MDRPGTELNSPAWEGFRLSNQQERTFGLAAAGASARLLGGAQIAGEVDPDLLAQAARQVVSAHEILRSSYRKVLGDNSSTLMVIDAQAQVSVTETAADEVARAEVIDRLAKTSTLDSCLEMVIFGRPDQGRSLIVSAPRAGMDSLSMGIFLRQLVQAYAAVAEGRSWAPENVLQYADFAQWQLEQSVPGAHPSERESELRAELAALPPARLPLELRSDHSSFTTIDWTLPSELVASLRARGEAHAGLRGVLLGAWLAALWHATGRPDRLAVDVMTSGRVFHELQDAVGNFERFAPVFGVVTEGATLEDLLQATGRELEAREASGGAAELPWQQTANLPGFGYLGASPLPDSPLGLSDAWVAPPAEARKVSLWVQDDGDRVRVQLRHRPGVMAEGGAEALATCLRAVLKALGEDFSASVSALPMLDETAAGRLVAAVNAQNAPPTPPAHWHRRVEEVAQEAPDRVAITSPVRAWTYREFDEAANQLSNELLERGVRAGELVGMYLERSDVALVAMLAIAKAGAGYVPVDPLLPPGRRSAVAQAVGFRHVVTGETAQLSLPEGCDVLQVDAQLSVCAGRDRSRPVAVTADTDPAYVLFTSGSTGTPKGVVVGHGQLAAYIDGVLDRLGLAGPIDSIALSTLGTDLGNTALFPPLVTGGTLRVVGPQTSADAQALAQVMTEEDFDLVKITPSHLEAVIAVADDPARVMPRSALVLGGEATGWGTYHLLARFLGGCRLYNHYGPSETTVGVVCGPVDDSALAGLASTLPLGWPMRHARCYVLDPHGNPVPSGVSGELWIGGSSVAQGYLPGTADRDERFVADPFSEVTGARMYRSGDRARLLPDLRLEFLGRMDRQIKVRGFRVELGEVEAVMRRHPRVSGSLVVVTGESMTARLVAYLIDAEGSRGSAEWLRPFLVDALPEYMVPAHLVALEAFPLTSTGKVDAAMLPEPGSYETTSRSTVPLRTPTERAVAAIWAELLLLKNVGADDDFFDIGGHSLLATQLIARLRAEFSVNVKLRNLFEAPVLSELSELVDQLLQKAEAAHV
ncbi:amino acid adenylation domain-containing protein [Kineosporia sp. J2-2]|uniref:Amino acid adenylation domain-containing protein n=1 Tax=Kineosporia corallincola TaxID=2835133 RepID=A0ABS5TQY8_9ACTN|nr:amino acid adenylation domain-containing protein [Kineosporia corallincola]